MEGHRGWVGLLLLLALAAGTAGAAELDPEDGKITAGTYRNPYFGLIYPLAPGWAEGPEPAPPSSDGYYVLNTPVRRDGRGPTMVIAAQDMFFSPEPIANAMQMAADLRRKASAEPRAETRLTQVTIAGRSFARLAIDGEASSRLVLATTIRCHVVSISLAAPDSASLDTLVPSFNALSLAAASATSAGRTEAGTNLPICIKNYATDHTITHRVEPVLQGPKAMKVPVRIIIAKNGTVKHIHVIAGDPEQRKTIETALGQWRFKPLRVSDKPVEVETGLVFETE
jgi:hypothetical protein